MSLRDGVSGSIAGAVSKMCMAPLDRVKVYTQTDHALSYNRTFVKIWNDEGILGYYKGVSVNCSRASVIQFVRFYFFEDAKKRHGLLLGSVKCAILQTLASHPLENLRQRMMMHNRYISSWNMLKRVHRGEGIIRGLYRGIKPAMVIGGLYVTSDFVIYNKLNRDRDVPPFIAGCVSGTTAQCIIYPFDAYMRRSISGTNMGSFRSLYNGFFINIVRVFPAGGIHYAVYERLRSI